MLLSKTVSPITSGYALRNKAGNAKLGTTTFGNASVTQKPQRALSMVRSSKTRLTQTTALTKPISHQYATDTNHRNVLERLAQQYGIKSPEDWYTVKISPEMDKETSEVFSTYGNSLGKALSSVFPEEKWQLWRFGAVPSGYWEDKDAIEWIGDKLGVKQPEDWYNVKTADVIAKGGNGLLQHHGNSLYSVLNTVYPNQNWIGWKFERLPRGYWENKENQRKFLETVGGELGVRKLDDWYKVKLTDVAEKGGSGLLALYSNSLSKALSAVYPNHPWQTWNFSNAPPSGFWESSQNQKEYMDWIGKQLGVRDLEDWYRFTAAEVADKGKTGFLYSNFNNSLSKALETIYPDHHWLPWRFAQVPKGFWDDPKNQRKCLDWLSQQLNLRSLDDWYNVKTADVVAKGGASILRHHGDSLITALNVAYPEHKWQVWKFASNVPKGFWDDPKNAKLLMDKIGSELQVDSPEDWYKVSVGQVASHGGAALLRHFDYSLLRTLQTAYPDQAWKTFQFDQASKGFWDGETNVREYIDFVAGQLQITKPEDWYSVSTHQLNRLKGLIHKNGGLIAMLAKYYPEHKWDFNHKAAPTKSHAMLESYVKQIFKNTTVLSNFKHEQMLYPDTLKPMEFDIFLADHDLAFDYQPEEHFMWHYMYGAPDARQHKDEMKRQACQLRNLTLIEIPFWWDGRKQTLLGTISKHRPDLIAQYFEGEKIATPIPERMPPASKIPNAVPIIEFIPTPAGTTRAEPWPEKNNPTEWWSTTVPEGLRVYWDGVQKFITEDGKEHKIPDHYVSKLPVVPLDCVLSIPPTSSQKIVDILRTNNTIFWDLLKVNVLDAPTQYHLNLEERMNLLDAILPSEAGVVVMKRTQVKSPEHLTQLVEEAQSANSEALFLRRPQSYYLSPGSLYYYALTKGKPTVVSAPSASVRKAAAAMDSSKEPVYYLALGKSSRVKCRGCKRFLLKDELRIQTTGTFRPPKCGPMPMEYNFCLSKECLDSGVKEDQTRSEVSYLPFAGIVRVPPELKDQLGDSTFEGISWDFVQ